MMLDCNNQLFGLGMRQSIGVDRFRTTIINLIVKMPCRSTRCRVDKIRMVVHFFHEEQ